MHYYLKVKLIFLLIVLNFLGPFAFAKSCYIFISRSPIHAASRTEFIAEYASKIFQNVAGNNSWIQAALVEKRKGLYIEITVSELKKLNDEIIKHKDLVTALVNLKKEYDLKFLRAIKGFESAEMYSDYKTIRLFIPFDQDQTLEAIESIYQKVQQAFHDAETSFRQHVQDHDLIRKDDLTTQWFHLGFADSADLATYAARSAKALNKMALNLFDPTELARLEKDRIELLVLFDQLSSNHWHDYLFNADKSSFSLLTIEIYRKNKSLKKFVAAVKDQFGYEISEFSAQKIIAFLTRIDIFSPSLVVTERTSVAIEVAQYGAFSLDFIGLGAKNLLATVNAVLKSHSTADLFLNVRSNELEVTRQFNADKQIVLTIVQNFFNFTGDLNELIRFSGDEGIILPNRQIELEDLILLQKKLLDHFGISQLRVTFMKADSRGRIDTELVSLAESIEKALRKNLVAKLEPALLNATQFNIWILDPTINGTRYVVLTLYSRVSHSINQRAALRSAFNNAVVSISNSTPNTNLLPLPDIFGELPKN